MKLKGFTSILLSVLLLSMGFAGNQEGFAITIQQEKQEIINELKNLRDNSETSKKSKKLIDKAIQKLEKSLDDKFWKDESNVNFKHGKKVLNQDYKAVKNKLDKILDDKKTSESIKNQIISMNLQITEIQKILVEDVINELSGLVMGEKALKKIDKATQKLEEGNELLAEGEYTKALKKYGKAWDQIKKALKDPHFKQLKLIYLEGTGDLDYDGDDDIYLKILKPKKPNQPYLVDIKMTSECTKGNTYDTAGMKIGFSGPEKHSLESFHEEFDMTNDWFMNEDWEFSRL